MTTLHPKTETELLVVKVPEDAHGFRVKGNEISFWYNVTQGGSSQITIFPPGSYSFISTTNRITEEQAAELVEQIDIKHLDEIFGGIVQVDKRPKNYLSDMPIVLMSSKDSLFSLLRSKGLDPSTKNFAILKCENK